MFNKKIKLFFVTLIFMLSISAIAAADTNSSDDMILGEVEEEPPSGSVQDSSADDNLDAASGGYTLSSSDVNMYYKNGSSYEVTLLKNSKPVQNASLSVNLNGVVYKKVTDESGKVSVPINLNSGSYVVSAAYNKVSVNNKVKVLPVVVAKDVTKTYKGTVSYTAKFLDNHGNPLKNANVKFKINNMTYTKKTNSNGIATLSTYSLAVGTYTVYAIHPNGYKKSNKIVVKTSIKSSGLVKHYSSYKKFSATFYGSDGKVLANKYIKFYRKGEYFSVKTNSRGVASIDIVSKPGSFSMVSINTETGEKKVNTVKILPTLYANKVTTFSDKTATFKVKLYKNEKLVKNSIVYVYIKGVKKTLKTNSDGVASVSFKLAKGTYTFTSNDPYTGYCIKTNVSVKAPTIKAGNKIAYQDKTAKYTATLLKSDGSVRKYANMKITLNGKTYTVKTNSKGVASLSFKLNKGTYTVTCKDLTNGYTISKKITVYAGFTGMKFNKYGVSEDGKYILAIGRPSAIGDASEYTWYKTVFERTCPYCHGHNLYWSVFWAKDETTDVGIFPATGNKEPGSIEGMIFCADCDCDFSVFGNEHVWSNPMHLTIVSPTVDSSKAEAYALKSGSYVYP
ncbi:Ig-like domain-containing protein [Methanobrevibacter sp.]|uniref:Ig-like domain-containing protein n=1 Tax=Methanobrevibacter sp. TaxID=66852 RepID=UPI0026DF31C1|nr:Ig-like domain-containing protein [Methanobrevibacter sp.]MDO5860210.1 Ig-like domain-containing protein [Methanobrevibacter sp.]